MPVPKWCDKKSIRTVKRGKATILICCPKGKMTKIGRCKVGTRAIDVRHFGGFGLSPAEHTRKAASASKTVRVFATRAAIAAKQGHCHRAFSLITNMNRSVGAEFAHTTESGGDLTRKGTTIPPRRAHKAFSRYCLPPET